MDVCTTCYGVWIEWFDGEIPGIAATVPPPSRASVPSPFGAWQCPQCQCALVHEELAGTSVARCGTCAGAFVTRAAIEQLSHLAETPPVEEETGFLAKLRRLFRQLLAPPA